jgi:hypothetical protein
MPAFVNPCNLSVGSVVVATIPCISFFFRYGCSTKVLASCPEVPLDSTSGLILGMIAVGMVKMKYVFWRNSVPCEQGLGVLGPISEIVSSAPSGTVELSS